MAFFSKKDKVALDMQSISTLISEGCILDGNMKATAFARIDGQLNGDVIVEEGLILGEKGIVTGNIITKELVIYGTVKGNVQVSSLDIKATGKINGEIRTQTLAVENGAIYNGNIIMTQTKKSEPKIAAHKQKVIEVQPHANITIDQ